MYGNALIYAIKAHENQKRKDGKPYISHPISVAIELAKNSADDDLISAGLLHDAIEDTTVTYDEIEETFGREIADLVLCDTENKKLPWEERKQSVIDFLSSSADRKAQMLICADKLANLKDIKNMLDEYGEDAWNVFKRGRQQQKWFYCKLVEALKPIDDLDMYKELKQTTLSLFEEEKK